MVISITRRSMYIVCWHRNRSQMFSDDFLVGQSVLYCELFYGRSQFEIKVGYHPKLWEGTPDVFRHHSAASASAPPTRAHLQGCRVR